MGHSKAIDRRRMNLIEKGYFEIRINDGEKKEEENENRTQES